MFPLKNYKGGKPLLVIRAKGYNPYTGYDVTIATDGKRVFQRFPTANEAAGTGMDMW